MSTPDKCPQCGCSEILPTSKRPHRDFACRTTIWSDDGAVAVQGMGCMRSQRDAWRAYAERMANAGEELIYRLAVATSRPLNDGEQQAIGDWREAKRAKP